MTDAAEIYEEVTSRMKRRLAHMDNPTTTTHKVMKDRNAEIISTAGRCALEVMRDHGFLPTSNTQT